MEYQRFLGKHAKYPLSKPNYHIDPSGYIYDIDTDERIYGATTTVYWIPCDDEDETYWDYTPSPDEYGEMWDASEFSQYNPLTTDIDGRYAWDVPEGWWRVKVEMAGYETTWSDWVPVPPPQTEVNIGMMPIDTAAYSFRLLEHTAAAATIRVRNQSGETANANWVIAAYDANARMIGVTAVEEELDASETITLSISCEADEVIATLKGFALKSAGCLPMAAAWVKELAA